MSRALILCAALAAPGLAHGYEITQTSSGMSVHWAAGTVPVEVGATDAPRYGAVVGAVATYERELGRMTVGVSLGTPVGVTEATARDGTITVEWMNEGFDDVYVAGALAVTVTSFSEGSGDILGAHVVVNGGAFEWLGAGESMDGCSGAFDLQGVLTHELGHALGLGHSAERSATMFPSTGPCHMEERNLANDDVLGLEAVYLNLAAPMAGCSVGGSPRASSLGPLVLLGWLLLRRRRSLAAAAVTVVAVGLAAPAAQATTMRELSVDDLGRTSTVVARGLIASVATVEVEGRIYTDTVLAVSECLKGPCGALVTVRQLGGAIAGVGMRVEGSADLARTTEVVLCLARRRDGAFNVTGMAQGAFTVERDVTGAAVVGLRRDLSGLVLVGRGGDGTGDVEAHIDLGRLRRAARIP